MMALTFDTLKYANKLKAANVPPQQAEAEAEALAEILEFNAKELATKADMHVLEEQVNSKFDLLRKDMVAMESRVDTKFDLMRKDMVAMESGLRKDMQAMEMRLTIKLSGVLVVALGAFTALSKWIG